MSKPSTNKTIRLRKQHDDYVKKHNINRNIKEGGKEPMTYPPSRKTTSTSSSATTSVIEPKIPEVSPENWDHMSDAVVHIPWPARFIHWLKKLFK